MFIPNNRCKLFKKTQGFTATGEPQGFETFVETACAIVRISLTTKKTSVRADSSASRGSSSETSGASTLLFPATSNLEIDDVIWIAGFLLEVVGIEPPLSYFRTVGSF